MNKRWDTFYMNMALETSKLSRCVRKQVGAILVSSDYKNIIAFGFNGTASGDDNACEIDGVTKPEVLHAETNAIAKVAQSTYSSTGSVMYLTLSPCFDCAKLIKQSGIARVVYLEEYRDTSGIEYLENRGIEIEQFRNFIKK